MILRSKVKISYNKFQCLLSLITSDTWKIVFTHFFIYFHPKNSSFIFKIKNYSYFFYCIYYQMLIITQITRLFYLLIKGQLNRSLRCLLTSDLVLILIHRKRLIRLNNHHLFYFIFFNLQISILLQKHLDMSHSSDETRLYREAFSLFDKDHDDIIAPQELGNWHYQLSMKQFFFNLTYHFRCCSSFMWFITIRS